MATFWIDRCLGAHIVPQMLRDAGITVRTYADLYPDDPEVPDAQWIPEVTARGWVIVTKDAAITRSPEEITAIRRGCAIYVCLASKNMTGPEQGRCLLEHWPTVEGLVASRKPPLVVKVTRSEVRWHDGRSWRAVKRKRRRK